MSFDLLLLRCRALTSPAAVLVALLAVMLFGSAAAQGQSVNSFQCPEITVELPGGTADLPTILTADSLGVNTTLQLQPGVYAINVGITLPAGAFCIVGLGANRSDVVLLSRVAPGNRMLFIGSNTQLGIKGLVLDGGSTSTGLAVIGGNMQLEDVTASNFADSGGAAVFLSTTTPTSPLLDAVNVTFVNNTATVGGAVICFSQTLAGPPLPTATFTEVSVDSTWSVVYTLSSSSYTSPAKSMCRSNKCTSGPSRSNYCSTTMPTHVYMLVCGLPAELGDSAQGSVTPCKPTVKTSHHTWCHQVCYVDATVTELA